MRETNINRNLERRSDVDPRLVEVRGLVSSVMEQLHNGEGDAENGRRAWEQFVSAE